MKAEPCCTELGGVAGAAGFGRSVRDQRTLSPALLLLRRRRACRTSHKQVSHFERKQLLNGSFKGSAKSLICP